MFEYDINWLELPEIQLLATVFGPVRLRFVGGAVRNSLLGLPPGDIDAATPLPPEKAVALLEEAGIKVIGTGMHYGTVTAFIGKCHFEITTLRQDVEHSGRQAKIIYTDKWETDARRRDFTMNALYQDATGTIFDFVGGQEDALKGRVRFIGDPEERIREDYLRILRFFRFHAYYGKAKIDQESVTACSRNAHKLESLSGERIKQEIFKLLIAPARSEVFALMQKKEILKAVFPFTYDVERLESLALIPMQPGYMLPALALLLRSTGKAQEASAFIRARWKLSNAEYTLLTALCTVAAVPHTEKRARQLLRHLGKSLFMQRCLLWQAEGEEVQEWMDRAQYWEIPVFPLTGAMLLREGMQAGKLLGEQLRRAESYWEENEYRPQKNELIAWIKNNGHNV